MEGTLPATRDLVTFLAVARTGSLHAAAQRLNLTVSALSHRLRSLEEVVGVPLFERHGRGLRLTSAGTRFRDEITPGIDTLYAATAAAQQAGDDLLVRVAAFQMFHTQWLARRIKRFIARVPGANIMLLSLRSKQASPDLVLRISREAELRPSVHVLCPYEIGPVCDESLTGGKRVLTPEELFKLPQIIPTVTGNPWREWASQFDLEWRRPKNAIVVDSLPLAFELVASGTGVALLGGNFDPHPFFPGLYRPLPRMMANMGWLHVNSQAPRERPIVTEFRNWLISEFENDPYFKTEIDA